jgi:glycosyltransferase involved in cell wall biosynthesis
MRLLVIRGDLQSHSGYSAAARDYCRVLQSFFDRIIGVDIHFGANRPFEAFGYPVVSEEAAQDEAKRADQTLVLSITTPDCYKRYPNARNIGMTFWETDRLPTHGQQQSPWVAAAQQMDALWAPSTHTAQVFKEAGISTPIAVVPWPMKAPAPAAERLPDGDVYDLDRHPTGAKAMVSLVRFHAAGMRRARRLLHRIAPAVSNSMLRWLKISPSEIKDPQNRTFLCVAQDVPRKALLLLLSEWMEFKTRPEAAGWSLILKTSPIDPAMPRFDLVMKFWEHIQALKRQLSVPRAGVYLWTGALTPADFDRLEANTFAAVISSMGEGFCGPAASALLRQKPLIAPRHTSMADYIPADYPFQFATRLSVVNFVGDPLRVYDPVSAWNVPVPRSIADALSHLVRTPAVQRLAAAEAARHHFLNWCSPESVRTTIARELSRLPQ